MTSSRNGAMLSVLASHFKSKRNGDDQQSQNRRLAQANRAHVIAKEALARSELVLLAGDLNDTPASEPLQALFSEGFIDIQHH